MALPEPEITILKSYPKGVDVAAIFPNGDLLGSLEF